MDIKAKIYKLPSQWEIPKNIGVDVINHCIKLAYNIQTSKLDIKKSWAREVIKISLEGFIDGYSCSHSTFEYFGVKCNYPNDTQYLSIGFVYDNKNISYYIFLDLDIKHLEDIVSKFELHEL